MKLIYIYFDFTYHGKKPEGYRGYKKVGLNFGTEYYFQMEEPQEKGDPYRLKATRRPDGERIEPKFWNEDERLYNVSALVGDNGAGKSTLIHEMIRCLSWDYRKGTDDRPPFVVLLQDDEEKHLPYAHCMDVEIEGVETEECVSWGWYEPLPVDLSTKLIYFSNALTMSDKQQFDELLASRFSYDSYGRDPFYFAPLYDCSLTTDLLEAIKVSGSGEAEIRSHLDTYYNFRSYQEARYVFDRSQRELLQEMAGKGFPVPVPKTLKLRIQPAFSRLQELFASQKVMFDTEKKPIKSCDNRHYLSKDVYTDFFETSTPYVILLAELCLNCIACFGDYDSDAIRKTVFSKKYTAADLRKSDTYFEILNTLRAVFQKHHDKEDYMEYYGLCRNYMAFLWNNRAHIGRFFRMKPNRTYEGEFEIELGTVIDPVLEELMIRFINLTRAVSRYSYFVVYNWGLSSGESNLLHMFTRLRYLLDGCAYETEVDTSFIPEDLTSVNGIEAEERKETIKNYWYDIELKSCDSVILFIDEADLTLHPDWQRQYVAILTEFLPKLYKNPYYEGAETGCKSIQVILGTHSPLMLGDFPAASVIYLKKEEDGSITVNDRNSLNPFGQDLYTLLRDGFNLTNGTFGELARRKIDRLFTRVQEIKKWDRKTNANPSKWIEELEMHQKTTVAYLPQGILRTRLEREIADCHEFLKEYACDKKKLEALEQEKEALERKIAELRTRLEGQGASE